MLYQQQQYYGSIANPSALANPRPPQLCVRGLQQFTPSQHQATAYLASQGNPGHYQGPVLCQQHSSSQQSFGGLSQALAPSQKSDGKQNQEDVRSHAKKKPDESSEGILSLRSSANKARCLFSSQPGGQVLQDNLLYKDLLKLNEEQIDQLLDKVNKALRKEQASLQHLCSKASAAGEAPQQR